MLERHWTLLVCGPGDTAALEQMIVTARRVQREQSRPLSAEMLKLRDKTESLWTSPGRAGALLTALQREEKVVDHNDQQEALKKAHENAGIDVFATRHTLLQSDVHGSLVSFAVLPKGLDT